MEEGTIIRLSYDMWLEDHEGLFDTTDRDRASETGIFDPNHPYGPMVTIVGSGRLIPGFEKALLEDDGPGDWKEIELEAADGYGARDPKLIETVPMQRLKQAKINPRVGERIRYKDRPATITRVAGGRVWIDTNSPLAGRVIKYRYKVDRVVEDPDEQVHSLLEMGYRPGVEFDVAVEGKVASITIPKEASYDQRFLVSKFRIAHDIGRYTNLETIRFIEEFSANPEPPTSSDAKPSAEDKGSPEAGDESAKAVEPTATN